MKSFSQLLKGAWSVVFRNKKTFWTLFLLTNSIGIITTVVFYFAGYNISNPADIQRMAQQITPYIIFILTTGIIGGFFGFIGMIYITNLLTEKKSTLQDAFSQWERIFSYIGTLICVALCYIVIGLAIVVSMGLIAGVGYLLYVITGSLSREIATILYIIAGVIGFVLMIGIVGVFVWISTSIYTFFIPAFFLDNEKYFNAPLASKKVIAGRWWNTVGKIFLGSFILMIAPIVLAVIQQLLLLGGAIGLLLSLTTTIINGLAGLLLITFLFSMYIDYKQNPVQEKIKGDEKKTLKVKTTTRKKTSK